MIVIGIGTDLVDVARLQEARQRHGDAFDDRCFTAQERSYAALHRDGGDQQLAARFAAKEAVLKALGTGMRDQMAWTDIEVTLDQLGAPGIRLTGSVAAEAARQGLDSWCLSMSHLKDIAIAVVVAGRKDGAER
ncbi:MAG: holo-ACP synthase [Planctomycetota bacterium]|nr:holo-ACP synthase [Planctomycetota bacterium]MDA1106088.1 holo-ACP synthase [Planctomycetota bacterium]